MMVSTPKAALPIGITVAQGVRTVAVVNAVLEG